MANSDSGKSGTSALSGEVFLNSTFFKSSNNYTADEQEFLKEFLPRNHDIAQKFDEFVLTNPQDRVEKAKKQLYEIDRTGLVLAGVILTPQTVGEHADNMLAIAKKLQLDDESLVEMIKVHDIAEAITGDIPNLPPGVHRKIAPEEKTKVEILAARLIFNTAPIPEREGEFHSELNPQDYELFMEYEQRKSDMSRWVKAIDMLEFIETLFKVELLEKDHVPETLNTYFKNATRLMDDMFEHKVPHRIKMYQEILRDAKNQIPSPNQRS